MARHLRAAMSNCRRALILNHYPLFSSGTPWRDLAGRKRLAQLLFDCPTVPLYLHGHNHSTTITQRPHYPITIDCGSATLLPVPTFRLLELSEHQVSVQLAQFIQGDWELAPSESYAIE
jgi:calcineurin-like phosphoesterase family protein